MWRKSERHEAGTAVVIQHVTSCGVTSGTPWDTFVVVFISHCGLGIKGRAVLKGVTSILPIKSIELKYAKKLEKETIDEKHVCGFTSRFLLHISAKSTKSTKLKLPLWELPVLCIPDGGFEGTWPRQVAYIPIKAVRLLLALQGITLTFSRAPFRCPWHD